MAELKYLPLLLTWTSLISSCSGQDSIVSIIQRLDEFQEEMLDFKVDMIRMEKRIVRGIDVAKTSVRTELKENIRDEVREVMAEILQGASLQDMVKSQIVSELRHLRQGYHQMKKQWHHMSRSLRDFQDETAVFQESILKKADAWNRDNTSQICVREMYRMEIEKEKCDATISSLKSDIMRCTTLKETCQSQLSQQKTNVPVSPSTPAPLNVTSTPRTSASTTTPRPPEKRRLLISAYHSTTRHQFQQLNIHSNSLSLYQYHNMREVTSLAYIAKTNKLLIGLYDPHKIVSSTLDTSQVTLLRKGALTYSMAVDQDRDIVFMFTFEPHSISRMSTQGKDFTLIIDVGQYGRLARQIALDTRRRRIYVCNSEKLFTVTYNGQGMTTLVTGSNVNGVTLDQRAGVMYYSIGKTLMKMTVSSNVSTEVTTLDTVPWNMRLYRGTIYYSGYHSLIVGAVDVRNKTVSHTLQSLSLMGAHGLCMCLIP